MSQALFDQIVAHLRSQGSAAMDDDGNCKYRADDGKKCAVGCLIPNGAYFPEMEGKNAGDIVRNFATMNHLRGHEEFLDDMQCLHDNVPVAEWEDEFLNVALKYGLNYIHPS